MDDFYNWLAGFIDGEGCFGLYKRTDSAGWVARFFIKLRDDDAEILKECQSALGGTIRYIEADNPKWGNQAIWTISSLDEKLKLIEVLDSHPLRAKKKLDYEVWKRAVLELEKTSKHLGNKTTAEANLKVWRVAEECKAQLTELRRYKPND